MVTGEIVPTGFALAFPFDLNRNNNKGQLVKKSFEDKHIGDAFARADTDPTPDNIAIAEMYKALGINIARAQGISDMRPPLEQPPKQCNIRDYGLLDLFPRLETIELE